MVSFSRRKSARKATWLAFGLIALAACSCTAQDTGTPKGLDVTDVSPTPAVTGDAAEPEIDRSAEASRAYKHALTTLGTLTAHPPAYTREPTPGYSNTLFNTYLQSPGPIASALRIALKLQHRTWLPSFLTSRGGKEEGARGRREEEMRGKAVKVVDLLQHAAELGNADALFTLGQLALLPPNTYFPADPQLAFNAFSSHADTTGNASSQGLLGFFYSTGYRGVVPVDQAKAQLYYTFAAHGGDKAAQMSLGYRFWTGIGTLQEVGRAMEWYEAAAEHAMAKFLSGPPGGRTLPLTSARLSDLAGGVYGPGASVASTGVNAHRPAIRAANARWAGETWEDVLEYYLYNADRGETDFAYRLGKIFYQGSLYASPGGIAAGSEGVGAVPRDFQRARYYFMRIARQIWPRDPTDPRQGQRDQKGEAEHGVGYAAASAGYIGRMFLRGEGVKADAAMARLWFERGAEYGDRECHNGLGIIWRDGLVDGKADLKKAVAHFGIAAGQDLAEAQVNLGKFHWNRGELKLAMNYFEAAVRNGSPFEAFYYLAEMHASQARNPATPSNIVAASCATAVSFYKLVAERGTWGDNLLRDADVAWATESNRGKEMAMLRWWMAAERGSEIAQNNLAYVLDQDKSVLRLTRFAPYTPSNDTARLALTQWTRSAAQLNVDALVKVGDYYYHGLGVPDEPESIRFEKAAGYYRSAADTQVSALAMWNLGWMYENGLGVPMDFHLAKRYYDLALTTNSEAYLPISLSLVKLYARSFWYSFRGGKGGLSLWDRGEDDGYETVDAGTTPQEEVVDQPSDGDRGYEPDEAEDDGPWYIGKARDQFNRRKRGQDVKKVRHEAEDPVQWARERRNAENEREGDFGPEDYFEGATRGAHRGEDGEEVDDFMETMLLLVLCLAVSLLIYVRGRWVERLRREQEQANNGAGQPPQDGGVFPPPGDPARQDWAVLR